MVEFIINVDKQLCYERADKSQFSKCIINWSVFCRSRPQWHNAKLIRSWRLA